MIGLSTGDGPITPVTNTAVDLTVLEFADTVGTTENVEDLQSRMDNQENAHYDSHGYEYDYDQGPPDDLGVSVAMTMAQNRRTQNRLPLTTISEEEQLQETMDTTEYPCTTTTTPNLVLTPLQNFITTSAPSSI